MDEAIHGISGGLSGMISALVWYPLETIRIRLQQKYLEEYNKQEERIKSQKDDCKSENDKKQGKEKEKENDSDIEKQKFSPSPSKKKDFSEESLLHQTLYLTRKIIKEEGFNALYNGIGSCLVGSACSYGVYFSSYKYWKNYFIRNNL